MELHLAQINIGKILAPIDSPVMAEFVANLDRINALAENSDGLYGGSKMTAIMPHR